MHVNMRSRASQLSRTGSKAYPIKGLSDGAERQPALFWQPQQRQVRWLMSLHCTRTPQPCLHKLLVV